MKRPLLDICTRTARPRIAASLVVLVALVTASTGARAQRSVVNTKHNLSATGPGRISKTSETRVCIFCHLTHIPERAEQPDRVRRYPAYNSANLGAQVDGATSGATRKCLSCHDGTIATGRSLTTATLGDRTPTEGAALDLQRSHPVSFEPKASRELRAEPTGRAKLDEDGKVQCASCHDPHADDNDPIQRTFLVMENRQSSLCLACHAPLGWKEGPSAHEASTKPYDEKAGAHTGYESVADNGCASCHRQHNAATPSYLLKKEYGELCIDCHDGGVASTNVAAQLSKDYAHPVLDPSAQLHDAAEGPSNLRHTLPERDAAAPRHVTCSDCHAPHAAFDRQAEAPDLPGALEGVWGITSAGERIERVEHEHEICFKCHGDSANKPTLDRQQTVDSVRREFPDPNLRNRFGADAISYHPVVQTGRSKDVPGLIAPLTESSMIYCSDCHSSDDSSASDRVRTTEIGTLRSEEPLRNRAVRIPRGPHGSIYPHILERNYTTQDFTTESRTAYALCYKCHDRDVLLSDKSRFPLHDMHVRQERSPCSACHDPHGVSATQGTDINNAHLINFDISIVSTNSNGIRTYRTMGQGTGTCSLRCHRTEHDRASYEPATDTPASGRPLRARPKAKPLIPKTRPRQ